MNKKYYLPLWISVGFILLIVILGIFSFMSFRELNDNYAKKLIIQKAHCRLLLSKKDKLIDQLQKQLLFTKKNLKDNEKQKEIMLDNTDRIKTNYDNQIKLLQNMNGKDNLVKQIHSTVTPNMIQKK
ncbi:MAG: hypothetical protein GY756_15130 [bacterium]|nr:hypothetical protein [bacterium]